MGVAEAPLCNPKCARPAALLWKSSVQRPLGLAAAAKPKPTVRASR